MSICKMKSFYHLYIILSLLGLCYQVYDYSNTYFKYRVTSKSTLVIPEYMPFMSLDICARYHDLMEQAIDDKDTSTLTRFKISEILNMTSTTVNLIESCYVRVNNSYGVTRFNSTGCDNIFKISKYVLAENICYRIQPSNISEDFEAVHITGSIRFNADLYNIKINPNSLLNEVIALKYVVSKAYDDIVPYLSNIYSKSFGTGFDAVTKTMNTNYYKIYYKYNYLRNLETPYETNCFNYSRTYEHCLYDCINDAVYNQTGQVSFTTGIFQPYDACQLDEENITSTDILDSVIENCLNIVCPLVDCVISSTTTYVMLFSRKTIDSIALSLTPPIQPDTYVIVVPAMGFQGFILLVSSCVGTWLGVSMLSINPFKVVSENVIAKINDDNNNLYDGTFRLIAIENVLNKHKLKWQAVKL